LPKLKLPVVQLSPHQNWPKSLWTDYIKSWGNLRDKNFKGIVVFLSDPSPLGVTNTISRPRLNSCCIEGVVYSQGIF
jgi:hypothetical protein